VNDGPLVELASRHSHWQASLRFLAIAAVCVWPCCALFYFQASEQPDVLKRFYIAAFGMTAASGVNILPAAYVQLWSSALA